MKTISGVKTRLLLPFLIGALTTFCQADERTEAAVASAKQWLAMIDKGEYKAGWKEAALFLKEKVNEEQFEAMISAVRKPFGAVESRELHATEFTKTLPGAPDGEYVVIQFKTSFAEKPDSIETVTPMKVEGLWKISGYFIK